jgi:hypothetical protein
MGYSVLTQSELNLVDLNSVMIDGELIDCVPRTNVTNDLFILQGDVFTQYDLEGILQYILDNNNAWNPPLN